MDPHHNHNDLALGEQESEVPRDSAPDQDTLLWDTHDDNDLVDFNGPDEAYLFNSFINTTPDFSTFPCSPVQGQ